MSGSMILYVVGKSADVQYFRTDSGPSRVDGLFDTGFRFDIDV
jgi:hypothetical protein